MAGRSYMGIPRDKVPWCPRVDVDKCIGCGQCLEICPNNVFAMNEQTGKIEVAHPENCVVLCDKCAGFCPMAAISFPDKESTKTLLSKLLNEVLENRKRDMKLEEIKKAVLELPDEDRLRLMKEIGPELCESVMKDPGAMAEMMPRCREMMARHPDMMARMREMMFGMCGPEEQAA